MLDETGVPTLCQYLSHPIDAATARVHDTLQPADKVRSLAGIFCASAFLRWPSADDRTPYDTRRARSFHNTEESSSIIWDIDCMVKGDVLIKLYHLKENKEKVGFYIHSDTQSCCLVRLTPE
jgi:hypothetical protein